MSEAKYVIGQTVYYRRGSGPTSEVVSGKVRGVLRDIWNDSLYLYSVHDMWMPEADLRNKDTKEELDNEAT